MKLLNDQHFMIFRIIVCPAKGFNSTVGLKSGYAWPFDLLAGNIGSEPNSISWNGLQSLNTSWQQIQDYMFPDLETLREEFTFWEISKTIFMN